MARTLIDFESILGNSPFEGQKIDDEFEAIAGVSFSQLDGSNATIAEVGSPVTAFVSSASDTPLGVRAAEIGRFFLTDDGILSGLEAGIAMDLSVGAREVSGALIDVDFDERWEITAYGKDDAILDTVSIVAGDPGTGEGLVTDFALFSSSDENVITRIEFNSDRDLSGAFGFALDNVSIQRSTGSSGDDDVIGGSDGKDKLKGRSGDDIIHGFSGNDRLFGNSGADTLVDGFGRDVLIGGGGADIFAIVPDGQRDRIKDFQHGDDVIDLSRFDTVFEDLRIRANKEGVIKISFENEKIVVQRVENDLSSEALSIDDFLF